MNNKKKDKVFAEYYNLNRSIDVLNRSEESEAAWLRNRKIETHMISYLLKELIDSNKIIEFSDTFYTDNKNLYPSIGQTFSENGGKSILLTPNVKTHTIKDTIIINVEEENPYGIFAQNESRIINNLKKEKVCFITEKDSNNLAWYYRTWAKEGIPCIFAVLGYLDKNLVYKDKKAKALTNWISHDARLKCETKFDYLKETNSFAKIYTITRKKD